MEFAEGRVAMPLCEKNISADGTEFLFVFLPEILFLLLVSGE